MEESEAREDAGSEGSSGRSAFSWPGRRRAERAAESAERAALEGLERLRARHSAPPGANPQANASENGEALRQLIFEATEQLRDAVRLEARQIAETLRAERQGLEDAGDSLRELIAQAGALVEGGEPDGEDPGPGDLVIDLNEASHADLRAIGMSETQASRVIRHRDFWGEFQSVSELDHVPGFTSEMRAGLEEHLRVGPDADGA